MIARFQLILCLLRREIKKTQKQGIPRKHPLLRNSVRLSWKVQVRLILGWRSRICDHFFVLIFVLSYGHIGEGASASTLPATCDRRSRCTIGTNILRSCPCVGQPQPCSWWSLSPPELWAKRLSEWLYPPKSTKRNRFPKWFEKKKFGMRRSKTFQPGSSRPEPIFFSTKFVDVFGRY